MSERERGKKKKKQITKRDTQKKKKNQERNYGNRRVKGRSICFSVDGRDTYKRRWEGTIAHTVREATVTFGCDPRHVSWMAIPCPRAATGNDCPASPQGAPLTPTHRQTHTYAHTHSPRLGTCGWMSSMDDRIHDPKIATVRPTTRRKNTCRKS